MNKKEMSPWVLPAAGAVTATAAGLIGGINLDDWKSMEPDEKAKKLLKCLVMGGAVGLGAEGVRQGYNTIKKRALEKSSNYKKSLLSYMMKRAVEESAATDDKPEEAKWSENTILGIPTHLAVGGGLGLAGGLTLYHFLTDKNKKKTTGYLGAGLGGLLTGVLGAGLFKGFSANEKNVGSDLYKRDAPKTPTTPSNRTTLLGDVNYFVGAPDAKLSPQQILALKQADNRYLDVGGKKSSDPLKHEKYIIQQYKKIAPELTNENIIQHLRFLNSLNNSTYATHLKRDVGYLNKTWGATDLTKAQDWIESQRELYNKPFSLALTPEQIRDDAAVSKFANSVAGPMAKRILQQQGIDTTKITNPVGYLLAYRSKFNPDTQAAADRIAANLGVMYARNNNIKYPNATNFYDDPVKQLETEFNNAKTDNLRLTHQYYTPDEFKQSYFSDIKAKRYIPRGYTGSKKLNDLLEQLRILRANPNISKEELIANNKELNRQIWEEIAETNGLPRSVFLEKPGTPGADGKYIDKGFKYTNYINPSKKGAPNAIALENLDDTSKRMLLALNNSGYNVNNLEWLPGDKGAIATASLGNGLKLNAVNRGGVIHFNVDRDFSSELERTPRAELSGKSLSETKLHERHPIYISDDGYSQIFRLNNDTLVKKDLGTGGLLIIQPPTNYINSLKTRGILPTDTDIVRSYDINTDTLTRRFDLSDGSLLQIHIDDGTYRYIRPRAESALPPAEYARLKSEGYNFILPPKAETTNAVCCKDNVYYNATGEPVAAQLGPSVDTIVTKADIPKLDTDVYGEKELKLLDKIEFGDDPDKIKLLEEAYKGGVRGPAARTLRNEFRRSSR